MEDFNLHFLYLERNNNSQTSLDVNRYQHTHTYGNESEKSRLQSNLLHQRKHESKRSIKLD